MMKVKDINILKPCPYTIKPNNKILSPLSTLALDTETYNGYATLISDSDKRFKIINDIHDILEFLTLKEYRNRIKFFFNLTFDVNAMIKYLDKKSLMDLAIYNKCKYENYTIKIIPNKALIISKNKQTYKFFDIFGFYQIGSLERTYNKTFICKNLLKCFSKKCRECKHYEYAKEHDGFFKSLNAEKGFKQSQINDKVIEYCIKDSIITNELCNNFIKYANELVTIREFYSNASLSRALIKKHLKEPYIYRHNPINEMAYIAYNGGRFECTKRGYIPNVWQYDINSAYPNIIRNLNTIKGDIIRQDEYLPDSLHSFFKVDVTIPDNLRISPLKLFNDKLGLLIYPTGNFKETYITKIQYETLKDYDFNPKILKAYHIIGENDKPFEFVKELYNLRLKYKKEGNPLQLPLKLALNGMYGLFIQTTQTITKKNIKPLNLKIDKKTDLISITYCDYCGFEFTPNSINMSNFDESIILYEQCPQCNKGNLYQEYRINEYKCGQFFNPIWASEITSNVQCQLFKESYKHMDNIISYATDSILTDKPINIPISSKLGEWSKEYENEEALIIGTGIYSIRDRKTQEILKNKFRGFGDYDLFKLVDDNRKKTIINFGKRKGFLKLKESVKQDRIKELNTEVHKTKILSPNFDVKRIWESGFKNVGELTKINIDSLPIHL